MGSKKKSAKQQEKSKGQANGHDHYKTSTKSEPDNKSRTNASQKEQDRAGKAKSKSSDSLTASPPTSRIPWRLLLVMSFLVGGMAVLCTNETAMATIGDVYHTHVEPQVLRASESLHQGLAAIQQKLSQDSSSSDAPDLQQKAPEAQPGSSSDAPSQEQPPKTASDHDRKAPESMTTTTTATPTTTAPPTQEIKSEKFDNKDKKPVEAKQEDEKKSPKKEEPKKDVTDKQQDKNSDSEKSARVDKQSSQQDKTAGEKKSQDKTEKEAASKQGEKDLKKPAVEDVAKPKVDDSKTDKSVQDSQKAKDNVVSKEPVVEGIKVKTTPKAEKVEEKPSDQKAAEKAKDKPAEKTVEKPAEKTTEKPAEKQAEKTVEKPAEKTTEKPSEKPKDKPAEKTTGKPSEKPKEKPAEKTTEKPAEKPKDKPAEKTTEKPAEKTTEKPAEKQAEKTVEKPAEKTTEKPAEKPKDKPAEKTTEKPSEKPKEKPAEKTTEKPAEKPKDKPAEKTTEKTTEKPAEKPKDKPAEKTTGKPAEKTAEKPAEKPKDKPAEKTTEKPAEKPKDKPAEKTTEKPAEKPKDKPADKTTEKPAEKQAEKTVEKPAEKTKDKPVEKSTEKPAEKAQDKPADRKPAEKNKDKLAEKPAEKAKDKPAEPKETVKRDDSYYKSSITSDADYLIRDKLDEADKFFKMGKYEDALRKYDSILRKHSSSPRAQLGRADTLDKLAEEKRSNELLEQCINGYERVLTESKDAPPELLKMAGRRLVSRQQFRGWGHEAIKTLKRLTEIFPDDLSLLKELGVSHLMVNDNQPARVIFQDVLKKNPTDGFAKVHLGFIIKTLDNNNEGAIPLMQSGIDSQEPGTQDGRFFFHLGDAYQRLGRNEEAFKVFKQGADIGVFLSQHQRSLYNVDNLTARPWWTPEQTGYKQYLKMLEDNWEVIRDEGLKQLDEKTGLFKPEAENLREKGEWKQLTMYMQGRKMKQVCEKVPKTCALIDKIPDAKGCRRGQVKFSVMSPGVHVWPHCGPTNCRLRTHLGLVVPEGPKIRVLNETRKWTEGKVIIIDDSFEHEVWHDGDSLRLILIVDFWHPEVTEYQKRTLPPV